MENKWLAIQTHKPKGQVNAGLIFSNGLIYIRVASDSYVTCLTNN